METLTDLTMPQRFLRPGLRNSERWNSVSFDAQSFYIRLLTLVDDYGRHDGRVAVLWAESWAVWNLHNPKSTVTLAKTETLLAELSAARLVELYEVEGKRVLQLSQWQERIRDGAKERWPSNPNPGQSQESAANRSEPQESAPKAPREARPSEEDCVAHAATMNPVLPETEARRFWAYYESNGWKVGRNPMRSWKAAMVNWRENWRSRAQGVQQQPKQGGSLAINSVHQADSVIAECQKSIAEIKANDKSWKWNGGIRDGMTDEAKAQVKRLWDKVDEVRKLKAGLND